MNKLKFLLLPLVCLIMTVNFVACNNDDDKDVIDSITVEGVWKENGNGYIFYWYLKSDGTGMAIEILDGEVYKESGGWKQSGNTLYLDEDVWDILELSATTLKVKCEQETINFTRSSLSEIEPYL